MTPGQEPVSVSLVPTVSLKQIITQVNQKIKFILQADKMQSHTLKSYKTEQYKWFHSHSIAFEDWQTEGNQNNLPTSVIMYHRLMDA